MIYFFGAVFSLLFFLGGGLVVFLTDVLLSHFIKKHKEKKASLKGDENEKK